jgi:hypothetical protein
VRHFSIRTLMTVLAISAVFLAAFRNADGTWARMTTILALASIFFGYLWSSLVRGPERTWWLWFATSATTYLLASITPLGGRLYTTYLLDLVHAQVVTSTIRVYGVYGSDRDNVLFMVAYIDGTVRNIQVPTSVVNSTSTADLLASFEPTHNHWRDAVPGAANRDSFQHVGQNFFCLLSGLIGGTAVAWYFGKRE